MAKNVPHDTKSSLKLPLLSDLRLTKPPESTGSPSYVTLFLKNLRLLDLHLQPSWPSITEQTFSTRPSLQNTKKRIESVEWALYHLFSIYDPRETYNKLSCFYPPVEPLQSLNLRQALYKCLETVKKSGLLGRDTVLRRTMLDECKGERLEEVLSVFSTVVLKKVVRESGDTGSVAIQWALENSSYTGERGRLNTMILVHKASLHTALQTKTSTRAKYNGFAKLVNRRVDLAKTVQESRTQSEDTTSEPTVATFEARELQEIVHRNWSGSGDWLRTIMQGATTSSNSDLLSRSFEELWPKVENDTLDDDGQQRQKSLMQHLDERLQYQNDRLAKWRLFEKSLGRPASSGTISTRDTPSTGLRLQMTSHQALQVPFSDASIRPWQPLQKHQELTLRCQKDLAATMKPRTRKPYSTSSDFRQRPGSPDGKQGSFDTLSDSGISIQAAELPELNRTEYTSKSEESEGNGENGENETSGQQVLNEVATPAANFGVRLHLNDHVNADEASANIESTRLGQDERPLIGDTHQVRGSATPGSEVSGDLDVYINREIVSSDVGKPYITPRAVRTLPLTSPNSSTLSEFSPLQYQALQLTSPAILETPQPQEQNNSSSPVLSPSTRAANQILASMSAASPSPMKRSAPTPHFPREPAAPFLPTTSDSTSNSTESELSRRTRLSISNLAAMTKNAELTRRKSIKEAEKVRRQSYLPKRLSTRFEELEQEGMSGLGQLDEESMTGKLVSGVVGWEEVDAESAFMSRPKVAND